MRIEIKTKVKVTNKDIRALYLLVYALDNSTDDGRFANLEYAANRFGYRLVKK